MKILVCGANGMLGQDLIKQLTAENHDIDATDYGTLNICDLEQIIMRVKEFVPDMIINCAAHTNVDGCETDIDNAYRINAIGPKNLAIAANMVYASLVHISTDYIFDGETNRSYLEEDFPNPQSVYGKSKYFGEQNVKALTNKYFILRTQWLYGVGGKNFVKTMLNLAKNSLSLKVVNDQFGSPTYTADLAEVICRLIKTSAYGTYHVTNSGYCTWFQFTKDIMELAGIAIEINPCATEEFPRPAKRPKFSVLENLNLRLCGFREMRHYKDALKYYLKEEGF